MKNAGTKLPWLLAAAAVFWSTALPVLGQADAIGHGYPVSIVTKENFNTVVKASKVPVVLKVDTCEDKVLGDPNLASKFGELQADYQESVRFAVLAVPDTTDCMEGDEIQVPHFTGPLATMLNEAEESTDNAVFLFVNGKEVDRLSKTVNPDGLAKYLKLRYNVEPPAQLQAQYADLRPVPVPTHTQAQPVKNSGLSWWMKFWIAYGIGITIAFVISIEFRLFRQRERHRTAG